MRLQRFRRGTISLLALTDSAFPSLTYSTPAATTFPPILPIEIYLAYICGVSYSLNTLCEGHIQRTLYSMDRSTYYIVYIIPMHPPLAIRFSVRKRIHATRL